MLFKKIACSFKLYSTEWLLKLLSYTTEMTSPSASILPEIQTNFPSREILLILKLRFYIKANIIK